MHGLDELAISSVGVDSVLAAVELVGQESTASGPALCFILIFSLNHSYVHQSFPQARTIKVS